MSTTTQPGSATAAPQGAAAPAHVDAWHARYRPIYVYQWPVRFGHWVAMFSIVILVVTGLYIAKPYAGTGDVGGEHLLTSYMRFAHYLAATLLVTTALLRVYWLFAGNKWERFPALFPVRKRDLKNLLKVGKAYITMKPDTAPKYIGHHPLQQLSYTGIYVLAAVEVATGFALYGLVNPGGFFDSVFGWMGTLLSWQWLRLIHHAVLWVFVIFIPLHVYLAVRAAIIDREGAVSSILSGEKFIRVDERYEDE
ncbi:MAG TPA: Ni/Fe-hydrogenase, b-type cytochrome subunit [Longimicrobiales bacterium]|nr:Ni/Fe-hydrogenase, b-type cytochrome subunit [Longimicrobiales bacterium]